MVLSNKKLKQKLRSLLAESLAASESKDSRKDDGGDGDIKEQLQSVRLLLASKSQKPRSSKRPKKRKEPPLPEDPKPAEEVEGAQQELNQKEKSRKRKRDGDGDGAHEPAKKKEKKKKKQGKKKEKKKKEKKTKDSKDEEEEKANEKGEKGAGSADEVTCEKRAAESVKTDESEINPKKVYVGGIPYYSMEDDIRSFFEGCGTITEVDCMRFPESGKFRGIAILDFKTEAAATRALALDGADMGGFYLKVQPYKAGRTQKTDFTPEIVDGYNRIYIGNLSWDLTEDDLRNLFSDCKVSSIRFGMDKETDEFKGYAHVDFDDSVSLTIALKLDQKVVCGRPVRIRCAVPKKAAETKSSSKSAAGRRDFKVAKRSCYECGVTGHLASACPRKRTVEVDGSQAAETMLSAEPAMKKEEDSTNVGNPKKKKRRTCYECGVPGHLSSNCPRKRVGEAGGSGGDR